MPVMDILHQEHRNIDTLLRVLEQELNAFDQAAKPDYDVISAVIGYFQTYPEAYHHPQENRVFEKLKARDSAAAAKVGDLEAEHRKVGDRLRRVSRAVESVLLDQEVSRDSVDAIVRNFITEEREHMAMEEHEFFPAAVAALQPEDWAEIAAARTAHKDPLFSDVAEEKFEALRKQILQLEQEAQKRRA